VVGEVDGAENRFEEGGVSHSCSCIVQAARRR
jgi:hypothetical protein